MTTHARQQIREAVATAVTGLATTGARVYQSRLHALRDSNLPCLMVNTDDEDVSEDFDTSARTLRIKIAGVAKASANLDDTLDQMALEVETAVKNGVTVTGKVLTLELKSISVEMVDSLDKPAGLIALEFDVQYSIVTGAPGTLI